MRRVGSAWLLLLAPALLGGCPPGGPSGATAARGGATPGSNQADEARSRQAALQVLRDCVRLQRAQGSQALAAHLAEPSRWEGVTRFEPEELERVLPLIKDPSRWGELSACLAVLEEAAVRGGLSSRAPPGRYLLRGEYSDRDAGRVWALADFFTTPRGLVLFRIQRASGQRPGGAPGGDDPAPAAVEAR